MQITGLKSRAANIPLIKPYTISLLGEVTTTRSVIVEVFTDQGLVGIGETDPELMFTGESQQTVMTSPATLLIHRNLKFFFLILCLSKIMDSPSSQSRPRKLRGHIRPRPSFFL